MHIYNFSDQVSEKKKGKGKVKEEIEAEKEVEERGRKAGAEKSLLCFFMATEFQESLRGA